MEVDKSLPSPYSNSPLTQRNACFVSHGCTSHCHKKNITTLCTLSATQSWELSAKLVGITVGMVIFVSGFSEPRSLLMASSDDISQCELLDSLCIIYPIQYGDFTPEFLRITKSSSSSLTVARFPPWFEQYSCASVCVSGPSNAPKQVPDSSKYSQSGGQWSGKQDERISGDYSAIAV